MRASIRLGTWSIVGLAAACSSTTNPPPVASQTDASATDGGGPGPVIDGGKGSCPVLTHVTTATKLSLDATWPASLAVSPGSDKVYIWLLSNYDIDSSNKVTGTTITCKNQTPPITLNATGKIAVGAPSSGTAQVQIVIPTSTWDKVNANGKGTSSVTGQIGGWNVGSSLYIAPSTSHAGLSPTSTFADPATTWPAPNANGTAIPLTDVADDDGDGHPGITAIPSSDSGFYVPKTDLTGGLPTDRLYLVTRTELSLYGTSTSCTEASGTATVGQFNNHVVGCDIPGATDGGAGTDCVAAQYGFIDSNTTVYEVTSGTFQTKELSTDGGGTCADVLAALP